ncbi:uncharacterized protein B0H18DRAFT_992893 [Fomitopsis serialis]|uniref:uncharacterized protein n=1 Tax=Fomitopsis serialis TaxID=139415 RepID=UPI002008543F|nr:uncharacterized protein B0H18DRAFT_992893 [Neoantrodia serialis]KAH9930659.1 hypothetical protein B0H18DRAFT_992893 [Neoantrodia serialis]
MLTQTDEHSGKMSVSQYLPNVPTFSHVDPTLQNDQPATTRDVGAAQPGKQQSSQRKQAFRVVDKLVTARMLAQEEGDGELLLREITNLTLAAAAQDTELERVAASIGGPRESAPIAPPVQADADRASTPWEEWAPQATSTPRLSPGSSATLLSPADNLMPLVALTEKSEREI